MGGRLGGGRGAESVMKGGGGEAKGSEEQEWVKGETCPCLPLPLCPSPCPSAAEV
jgi:hypothetical protein